MLSTGDVSSKRSLLFKNNVVVCFLQLFPHLQNFLFIEDFASSTTFVESLLLTFDFFAFSSAS
jgi:hypothetical protein